MRWEKSLAACAACAITFTGIAVATPVFGKPLVVTAPKIDEALSRRVSYRDLNLATMQGEQTLIRRVKGAVKQVCPVEFQIGYYDGGARECREFAWNGAKPQIDRAVLRAHQVAANGKSDIAPVAIAIVAPSY